MSELPKDGGAAFPIPNDDRPGAYAAEPGMSLRDYFAAKALIAIFAVPDANGSPEQMAAASYSVADAMLREREARSK